MANPLGLVKSTDGGATLQTLGFAGESDFHVLAVGYTNHAIYVFNPAHNSKLAPGPHYSIDNGATWQQSALNVVSEPPIAMTVHPTEAHIVALATEQGVMLSTDSGATFQRVGPAAPASASTFSPQGQLLFGSTDLTTYDVATKQSTQLVTPALVEQEVVTAIAVNPRLPAQVAFATTMRNIFATTDNGLEWNQLASGGIGVNAEHTH